MNTVIPLVMRGAMEEKFAMQTAVTVLEVVEVVKMFVEMEQ
jgi:hypothetical protein